MACVGVPMTHRLTPAPHGSWPQPLRHHLLSPNISTLSNALNSHEQSEYKAAHLSIRAQATSSQVVEDSEFLCKNCKAKGWIVCDFCNGQKTNVQIRSNRMYRRCPTCRAAGVLICPECKVYKCVTFPDDKDGGFEM